MHYDVDEIELAIYKIGGEFRCGGNRSYEAQDCTHEMCQIAFRYWKKIEGYLKSLKKCPSCKEGYLKSLKKCPSCKGTWIRESH